jgi:hypothetical protein
MRLPIGQDKKRNQALDAVASVAKTWSEWRLGARASKTVTKGAEKASKRAQKVSKRARKAASKHAPSSAVAKTAKGTPLKIAGAVAVVAGLGAALAKKLKGGPAEPVYTPPPPPAPFDPPAALADLPTPPSTPVAVDDLAPAEPEAAADGPAETAVDAAPDATDEPTSADEHGESTPAADGADAAESDVSGSEDQPADEAQSKSKS